MKKKIDVIVASIILGITVILSGFILITNKPVKSETFNKNGIDLRIGEEYKLEVKENAVIKSENENVAVVDSNGTIVAKGVGKTKVTVVSDGKEKTYTVEVIEIVEGTNDIGNAVITEVSAQNYTGTPITPEVDVVLNGKKLEKDIDYNISYSNNTNIGTASIQVVGIGDYIGNKTIYYKIEELEIKKTEAKIICSDKVYNGLQQEIATCSGGTIKNSLQKEVGEYKINCTGDNLHYDAKETVCKITPANINGTVVAEISEQQYTGGIVEPDVQISTATSDLEYESDYKVEYKNNIETGTAEIVIKGEGNYTGTKNVPFKIEETTEKTEAKITCQNRIYNGSVQTIAKCSGGTIKNANQTKVGSYDITCTGDSTHKDAPKQKCSITAGNIANAVASSIPSQTKTGKEIKPAVTLTMNGKKLENEKDYKLTYKNNKEVGEAEIIITGINNYKGSSKTVKFTINPPAVKKTDAKITCYNNIYNGQKQVIAKCDGGTIRDASQTNAGSYNVWCQADESHNTVKNVSCPILRADISKAEIPSIANQIYKNSAITPQISVMLDNKKLDSSNYAVSYSNNNKLGTATIKVTGKGNYTGSKTVTFEIVKEKTKAIITCSNKEYNGTAQVVATCSGGTIKNASQSKVGDYTISCDPDSSHLKADNKTCSITRANIKNVTVSSVAVQAYTGSPITPNVTVKMGDKTLIKNTDYTVSYSNNTSAGTAKIVITGIRNYIGEKTVTFKIQQKTKITCQNKQYNGAYQVIATCTNGTIKDSGANGSKQKEVGNYEVLCSGNGNYIDTKATCSITKANLSNATISLASKYKRTGSATKPTPAIKMGSITLKTDTDYTISYSNNDGR